MNVDIKLSEEPLKQIQLLELANLRPSTAKAPVTACQAPGTHLGGQQHNFLNREVSALRNATNMSPNVAHIGVEYTGSAPQNQGFQWC